MSLFKITKAESIDEINEHGSGDNLLKIMYLVYAQDGNSRQGYLSIDADWIRFQFRSIPGNTIEYRIIYGLTSPTDWKSI